MATPVITADDVRAYILDYVDNNIPLEVEYLSNTELDKCIGFTLDDFNSTPPILRFKQYDIYTFPYRSLLLTGSAAAALNLTKKKELRGEMQYNDGGIDSIIYHKTEKFQALYQEATQEYETMKQRIKRQLNLESCYGGTN